MSKWSEKRKFEILRKIGIMNGWGELSAPFHSCPKNMVEKCNDSCEKCVLIVGNEEVSRK